MEKTPLALTVNGEPHEVTFDPYKTLLEVLREDLNLCGTKHGCELGECGACAVLLDGRPVLSCLVLGVECGGREVVIGKRFPGAFAETALADFVRSTGKAKVVLVGYMAHVCVSTTAREARAPAVRRSSPKRRRSNGATALPR